ncbi:MAG: TRAP transporter substrate-binding protein DctP [Ignavibacteriales bacterium]|mgnify:CR=1 FL=1|nr:MAG: ABC transporter substrate-binding protein [Ignavibacteriaceae bacterium]MBW7873834.1 TRAP transporter substrate-binding protein DctP [Ignavibacteria bacterium]MCZ2144171.1 TRAP transporter substrate-binding protein DctP [Ignavibacteriales bacterium]OQY76650.1 MAG: ABC transporter substrate-binding protein [Ignavibacteriales bacterium UTCHB3]MBV6445810.1 Monocarboxylate 2-oxoacid-binding periplasmic protein [Ignavibacteriaceae bacterium]
MSKRREFIKKAAFVSTAAMLPGALSSCMRKENRSGALSSKKFKWKLTTAWPPNFPVFGSQAVEFAERVGEMSGGRLEIKPYAGGELVPAMESFDAVKQGNVEMVHSASYYWVGKEPAAVFFSGLPFGMNAPQTAAWFRYGGGQELWTELYNRHGLLGFPAGNTSGQMGGWFKKEIKSVDDFKGLKMRIPGFGGKVMAKLGANALLFPGGELYTNLERGVLDALEWVGPYHDYKMGFHRIAPFYYYPGWQEPGSSIEFIINKKAFEELPEDLKNIVLDAMVASDARFTSEMLAKNGEYLEVIKKDKSVKLLQFPEEILEKLREKTKEVLNEMISADPFSKKVYESYRKFHSLTYELYNIAERNYPPI